MQSGQQPDEANVLMLTDVLRILPSLYHHSLACSSGPNGYFAVKETLQNGKPGHILLIESCDVCEVESSESHCCLLSSSEVNWDKDDFPTHCEQISPTVSHVTMYGHVTSLQHSLLSGCTGLTSVDLSPLSQVREIGDFFLSGCTGLTAINLTPLSQISKVRLGFLQGCTSLTSVDLGPLSQVTEVHHGFLSGCTGLKTLDLAPLAQVRELHGGFLMRCTGLSSIDLSPLSQVIEVQRYFLMGCTGLTTLDLSPLAQVTEVQGGFLYGCEHLTTVHNITPLFTTPPCGLVLKEDTKQWVRQE